MQNIAVIGSSGAIGGALVHQLQIRHPDAAIFAFSQRPPTTYCQGVFYHQMDYALESSIATAANTAAATSKLDLILVATGILQDGAITPEKGLNDLSMEKFQRLFQANSILPAMVAKHFIPKLHRDKPVIFAALSARVGSISDNRLGGWYAYRASKAALNMIIKTAAIDLNRRNKQAIVVGLHPGTVDSELSAPFQKNVPVDKLFSPEQAANYLLDVLSRLSPNQSGKCIAWDGREVEP